MLQRGITFFFFFFKFQDAHDAILERLREEKLSAAALVIQRTITVYRDRLEDTDPNRMTT